MFLSRRKASAHFPFRLRLAGRGDGRNAVTAALSGAPDDGALNELSTTQVILFVGLAFNFVGMIVGGLAFAFSMWR